MTPSDMVKFKGEVDRLRTTLASAKNVLLTAPAEADGDSLGSQLALRRMLNHSFPHLEVAIVNDEPLADRYLFLADVETVKTPENYTKKGEFDVAILVDGGVDRTGRTRAWFENAGCRVFIDHHVVSCEFAYDIRIVESTASATTQMVYYLAQEPGFATPMDPAFAQQIYLGLIFDTGFFRHSNTTPAVLLLAAELLKTGFNFTETGERGMLARTFPSLKLLSDTLARAETDKKGKVIWSSLSQEKMNAFDAVTDDREGIIDHLFLTQGIEVAVLFFELEGGGTKVSFRSQGNVDVARFARSLTKRGGGHRKAAGANFDMPLQEAIDEVLGGLSPLVARLS